MSPNSAQCRALHFKGIIEVNLTSSNEWMIMHPKRISVDGDHLCSPFLRPTDIREEIGVPPPLAEFLQCQFSAAVRFEGVSKKLRRLALGPNNPDRDVMYSEGSSLNFIAPPFRCPSSSSCSLLWVARRRLVATGQWQGCQEIRKDKGKLGAQNCMRHRRECCHGPGAHCRRSQISTTSR